jgi:hypothetical protein
MEAMTSLAFVSDTGIGPTGSAVAQILGVTFSERESSYRGGDYLLAGDVNQGEHIIVQRNIDLEELAIATESESATVVYVEGTTRPDEVQTALAQVDIRLVRRTDLGPTDCL